MVYNKKLTCQIELQGEEKVTVMELLRCLRELCGGLMTCRQLSATKFKVTMTREAGLRRLLDGFKIWSTVIIAKELTNDELVVSFLALPAYITDEEIIKKLTRREVTTVSSIKRRMWPRTNIDDGTRCVTVILKDYVQSLPYSAKFMTVTSPEYVRVIHDREGSGLRLTPGPGLCADV
ncbi:uncharacterized protein LOC129348267 [Amphiprion ocellaris]|uniref:uncharacterized protein LOC129348267 n=1 Tax=Amphiprion ocellaris TaxID=80972 RepID=UPI002411583E|nr:uncharacterized protein LOC129348267 [Amphiprion ocellaris]